MFQPSPKHRLPMPRKSGQGIYVSRFVSKRDLIFLSYPKNFLCILDSAPPTSSASSESKAGTCYSHLKASAHFVCETLRTSLAAYVLESLQPNPSQFWPLSYRLKIFCKLSRTAIACPNTKEEQGSRFRTDLPPASIALSTDPSNPDLRDVVYYRIDNTSLLFPGASTDPAH